jgi:hypothetical protein
MITIPLGSRLLGHHTEVSTKLDLIKDGGKTTMDTIPSSYSSSYEKTKNKLRGL